MIIGDHGPYDIGVIFLILTSAQKPSSKSLEIYQKIKKNVSMMKCVIKLWYNIRIQVINKDKKRRWWSTYKKLYPYIKREQKKGKKGKKVVERKPI